MAYRIRIQQDGRDFEAEGDKKFVLDMLKRFVPETGGTATPLVVTKTQKKTASAAAPATTTSGKSISVGEFIRQLGLKKHTDFVLAFGYYLEHYAGLKSFSPADLNNCYYEAKLETSNTSQMIIQNIRRGFMMTARKDKAEKGRTTYVVTHSGEQYLEKATKKESK